MRVCPVSVQYPKNQYNYFNANNTSMHNVASKGLKGGLIGGAVGGSATAAIAWIAGGGLFYILIPSLVVSALCAGLGHFWQRFEKSDSKIEKQLNKTSA